MVETDAGLFNEVGGQIVSKIFSGVLWFGVAIIVISVVAFLMYYFLIYRRKFDIKVKIISNRSDDRYRTLWDKAAILFDRKNNVEYFKIWGLKREFPVPDYKVLQSTTDGDYLEIYRDAENVFYYLTPPRINKKYVIKSDGKKYLMADQIQTMVDADMAYWNTKRKSMNKAMFDTEKLWMKVIPYIPHIIAGVITIFILYVLMDSLPQILQQLQSLASTLNQQTTGTITPG